jgi:hypothetical protein
VIGNLFFAATMMVAMYMIGMPFLGILLVAPAFFLFTHAVDETSEPKKFVSTKTTPKAISVPDDPLTLSIAMMIRWERQFALETGSYQNMYDFIDKDGNLKRVFSHHLDACTTDEAVYKLAEKIKNGTVLDPIKPTVTVATPKKLSLNADIAFDSIDARIKSVMKMKDTDDKIDHLKQLRQDLIKLHDELTVHEKLSPSGAELMGRIDLIARAIGEYERKALGWGETASKYSQIKSLERKMSDSRNYTSIKELDADIDRLEQLEKAVKFGKQNATLDNPRKSMYGSKGYTVRDMSLPELVSDLGRYSRGE